MASQRIKAISFDGDMTLWDFQKVMRHSLAITLAEMRRRLPGPGTSDLTIEEMIVIREAVAGELKGTVMDLELIRLRAFQRTVAYVGGDDDALATDLNALYLKHRFEDIELYPDVVPCLDSLRTDYCIGLLSNGNSHPDRCGLPDRFHFVVFSEDVGAEKPDPLMFHTACARAGCGPSELVHVGDSLENDVGGANEVGAVSVWLNREGVENHSGVAPAHEIRSLAELQPLLGVLS